MIYNIAFTLKEREKNGISRDLVFNLQRNLDHLHKDDDLLLTYFDPTSTLKFNRIRLIYIRKEQEFVRTETAKITYFFNLNTVFPRDYVEFKKLSFHKKEIDNLYECLTQFCLDQDF